MSSARAAVADNHFANPGKMDTPNRKENKMGNPAPNLSNSTSTLGQIGYEGYCAKIGWKSLATGADLPPFAETKPEIQAAWEAAADAITLAYTEGTFSKAA